jgi:hypothetical protein
MKTFKLVTAGLLSMLAINVASALTEIRLTGSTAFRNATDNAIRDTLQTGYVWGSTGGTGIGANQEIFVGLTITSNVQVEIKCSWSGSAGGIQTVASVSPSLAAGQPFIIDATGVSFSGANATATVDVTPLTAAGASIASGDITESAHADVALSDAYQTTTNFVAGPAFEGVTYTNLKDTLVGVVPFEWVKGQTTVSIGGVAGVTNVSIPQAQALMTGGIAMNQFTGLIADQSVIVGIVGRDHDSGTRIGAFYDGQIGGLVFGSPTDAFNTSCLQYEPNGATVGATQFDTQSAGTGTINALAAWPTESVLGETRPSGSEGFFSGSNVKGVLNRQCDLTSGNYIISYLGMSDANGVNPGTGYSYTDGAGHTATVTPSLNALTFGGYYPGTPTHPFGPPYTNILQGIYTFWGYEHYLYNSATIGAKQAVADQIAAQVKLEADYNGVGIKLSDMVSSRTGDGLSVTSP